MRARRPSSDVSASRHHPSATIGSVGAVRRGVIGAVPCGVPAINVTSSLSLLGGNAVAPAAMDRREDRLQERRPPPPPRRTGEIRSAAQPLHRSKAVDPASERQMWRAVALQGKLASQFLRGLVPGVESRPPPAGAVGGQMALPVSIQQEKRREQLKKESHRMRADVSAQTDRDSAGALTSSSHVECDDQWVDPRTLRRPRPTLAQRVGLEPMPVAPPTMATWRGLEEKALSREDVLHPCPICLEPFRLSHDDANGGARRNYEAHDETAFAVHLQAAIAASLDPESDEHHRAAHTALAVPPRNHCILLSCGHIFHEHCLQQIEKFARKQHLDRRCPVCREANYFKKRHVRGKAQLQLRNIVLVQATVRGFLGRRLFLKIKLRSNPAFRVDHFYATVRSLTDALLAFQCWREDEVTRVLREADAARAASTAAMLSPADWQSIQQRWRGNNRAYFRRPDAAASHTPQTSGDVRGSEPDADEDVPACVICLQELNCGSRPCVISSCGHVFHAACLTSFERFASSVALMVPPPMTAVPTASTSRHFALTSTPAERTSRGAAAASTTSSFPCCPMCRTPYASRPLQPLGH